MAAQEQIKKTSRPILFSTPMVQGILENRKFQTRRLNGLDAINDNPDDYQFEWADYALKKPWRFTQLSSVSGQSISDRTFEQVDLECPFGKVNDMLWVRESYSLVFCDGMNEPALIYKADTDDDEIRWKPSIHMPREVCRLKLDILKVGVQRISSISEEDAIAEGIKSYGDSKWENYEFPNSFWNEPYGSFRSLWQSIHGKPKPISIKLNGKKLVSHYIVYAFDEQAAAPYFNLVSWKGLPLKVVVNPWVWAITFKRSYYA